MQGSVQGRPRRESHPTRLAEEVLDRIRTGFYPIGSRLPSERQLAAEFEVSRPVVREALSIVGTLEVIDVQAGRGAFVVAVPDAPMVDLDGQSGLLDIVDVREVLESGALSLAVRRQRAAHSKKVKHVLQLLREAVSAGEDTTELDVMFHHALVESADSPCLLKLWDGLSRQINATIRISPHGRVMSAELLALHESLASAVTKGDLETSLAASQVLYEDNRRFLRSLLGR